MTLPPPLAATPRLASLDVFRGATIAGMILVNNPGSWGHIYAPLRHADWHGWTPTDLVFPFFLLIVGVALPFSLSRRKALAEAQGRGKLALMRRIVLRSAALFGFGLLLHGLPLSSTTGILSDEPLRIMGVLQRIALCYLAAATLMLFVGWRGLLTGALVLMAIYSALLLAVPVPGHGAGNLTIEGNLPAYLDMKVLGQHCYRDPPQSPYYWEPEGLLSTLPAIATTLMGTLAGLWLRTGRDSFEKSAGLFAAGVVGLIVGYVLDGALMPINKGLWTPSYVFHTAGLGLLGLGLCYWLIDVQGHERWSRPLRIYGMNALAMFVLSGLAARAMGAISWTAANGDRVTLRGLLYRPYQAAFADPKNASLAWAVSYVALFLLLATALYRRRIFIKV